jgi:phosphatidylglycerophosphate synthase
MFGYFLDCVDGNLARKYNQTSVFGAYFDHLSDLTVHTLLIVYVMYHIKIPLYLLVYLLFIISFLFISSAYNACIRIQRHNENFGNKKFDG